MLTRGINLLTIPSRSSSNPISLLHISKHEMLERLDKAWRSEDLFKEATNFYNHLETLRARLQDDELFSNLLRDERENFKKEFLFISNKNDLTLQERAITLTQAFELALLGIDTSSTLRKIGSNKVFQYQDNTKGYRQEIFATWATTKFIFTSLDKEKGLEGFKQSVEFNYTCPVKGISISHEVDIVTPDSLISVKDRKHSTFSSQIRDLFSVIIGTQLQYKIKKIISIKSAYADDKLQEQYTQSNDHNSRISQSLDSVYSTLFNKDKFPLQYAEVFKNLKFEIHFIPSIKDSSHLRAWMKRKYNEKQAIIYINAWRANQYNRPSEKAC
ncbi:MAG: hypothetical protein HYY52_00600 [Candidatus Melainabacteria bacterium]|nr:hypothetical protein [Candidatus Melainabacteria bacterium]